MARDEDLIMCAAFIDWMRQAFAKKGTNAKLKESVEQFSQAFTRVIQSYEEEIECLKAAQNADSTTQTASLPARVDSAVE